MKNQIKKFNDFLNENRGMMQTYDQLERLANQSNRPSKFRFKEKDSTEFAGKVGYETEPQYALKRIATNSYGEILIYQNVGDDNIAGLSRKNIKSTYDFGMVLNGETVIEIEGLSAVDANYLFDLFVA